MLLMPNARTYSDEQLVRAVAQSTNWAQVMSALGKSPKGASVNIKAVAVRLGLDTSHFSHRNSFVPIESVAIPFSNSPKHGAQSGLSSAARWFLERGYSVSVPLEPAVYDLVVESDEGLKRIQVKTTTQSSGNGGRYTARVSHAVRSADARRNANGNRKAIPYTRDEIDYFFIVTPESSYLVPINLVDGRLTLVLDDKWAAFKL
jgi:hypothetical protein